MLVSVFLALFLPCVGMSAVFVVYACLLWLTSGERGGHSRDLEIGSPVKPSKGLSAEELERLPKVKGKELVMGNDCAVCLDEIGSEEMARIVPGCNHGFHVECADEWLKKKSVCPVCRARLGDQVLSPCQIPNPC